VVEAAGRTMNSNNLLGLSPLWLISLALVLGTSIVVLLPFAISGGDAIKASDWIGFAGSVVAGSMALVAALVAWFSVQGQIKAQERIATIQTAIQKSAILNYQIEILQNERRLARQAALKAKNSAIPQDQFAPRYPNITFAIVEVVRDELQQQMEMIDSLLLEIDRSLPKQWYFKQPVSLGTDITNCLLDLKIAVNDAHLALHVITIESSDLNGTVTPLPTSAQSICMGIDLRGSRDKMLSIVAAFDSETFKEVKRLTTLVELARKHGGF
jgi:hypothetical protein